MPTIHNSIETVGSSIINRLMRRYFVRLGEAVAEIDPTFAYATYLQEQGIGGSGDPVHALSWDDFFSALRALAVLNRFAGVGLRFGARLRLADYGVAGVAIASAPDFGSAMRLIKTSAGYVAAKDMIQSHESVQRGRIVKTFTETHAQPWVGDLLIDEEVSSCLSLMRDIIPQADFTDCTVSLARKQPVSTRIYTETLKCRVLFEAEADQISYPVDWHDYPLEHADPVLKQLMEQQCELVIEGMRRQGSLVDRTRRLLMTTSGPTPSLTEAAAKLGLPVHTYRRRLYEAGTHYKEIVLRIRMERATALLAETSLPLQEIAYLIGYEHPANFHAAYKRHMGQTPLHIRQQRQSIRP